MLLSKATQEATWALEMFWVGKRKANPCASPWGHSLPDRLKLPTTAVWNKVHMLSLALETCSKSTGRCPQGCCRSEVWGMVSEQFKASQQSPAATAAFLHSTFRPCFKFFTRFQSSTKLILTAFASSLVAFVKKWSPRVSYTTIFSDTTP